jgi:hypothetical protein
MDAQGTTKSSIRGEENVRPLQTSVQKRSPEPASENTIAAFRLPMAGYAYFTRRVNKHWARYLRRDLRIFQDGS